MNRQQDLYMYYIHYQHAFDSIKHEEDLIKLLQEVGVDGKDRS